MASLMLTYRCTSSEIIASKSSMAGRSGSAGGVGGVTLLGWAALPPMASRPRPLLSDKAPLAAVGKSPRFGETMLSSKEVAASSLERILANFAGPEV